MRQRLDSCDSHSIMGRAVFVDFEWQIRLLHSPSPVALGLPVVYETWSAMAGINLLWLVGLNIGWDYLNCYASLTCSVGIHTVFHRPLTVLLHSHNGKQMLAVGAAQGDHERVMADVEKLVINTLRPRQNGRHVPDDICKCIFSNENVWISIKISLKFVPNGPVNNIPALVQIMAWRRPGDKPLSEPMMVRLLTHICVTRPQWVNKCWWRPIIRPGNDVINDQCSEKRKTWRDCVQCMPNMFCICSSLLHICLD